MHVIRADFTFYDLYSFPRTQLPQDLPAAIAGVSVYKRRGPDGNFRQARLG